MKYVVLFAFIAIIGSLASALFYMMRNSAAKADGRQKMARALTVRIGLSIVLFLAILLGWKLGYLHPTGIPLGA